MKTFFCGSKAFLCSQGLAAVPFARINTVARTFLSLIIRAGLPSDDGTRASGMHIDLRLPALLCLRARFQIRKCAYAANPKKPTFVPRNKEGTRSGANLAWERAARTRGEGNDVSELNARKQMEGACAALRFSLPVPWLAWALRPAPVFELHARAVVR